MTAAVARVRLRPLAVLGESLRIYRRHWWGLTAAALVLFGPFAVVDAVLEHMHREPLFLEVAGGLAELALHLLADVLYAGLVASAVIAWRLRAGHQSPLQVARALPWRTIAVLDVLLAVGTVVLLIALVVPGVLFYTYHSLAPAVAKLDHASVREALRRSRRLVRGSFWRVLTVLAIVLVGGGILEQAGQGLLHEPVGDAIANLVVQIVFGPLFGLATVLMAFDLRGEARPAPAPAAVQQPALEAPAPGVDGPLRQPLPSSSADDHRRTREGRPHRGPQGR